MTVTYIKQRIRANSICAPEIHALGNVAGAVTIDAEHHRGDSLVQVGYCVATIIRIELCVAVYVNESGRDPQSGSVQRVL